MARLQGLGRRQPQRNRAAPCAARPSLAPVTRSRPRLLISTLLLALSATLAWYAVTTTVEAEATPGVRDELAAVAAVVAVMVAVFVARRRPGESRRGRAKVWF